MAELRLCQPSKATINDLRAHVPAALNLGTRPGKGMGLTFASFLRAGAVPPYSDFLLAVLRHYGIRLAHLTANSITILSVFSHLCVKWLGVPPSLDLFRSYYTCRCTPKPKRVIGSCHFLLIRENKSTTEDDEFIHVQSRVCFKGWHDKWLYIEDGGLEETSVPAACAESIPSWNAPVPDTPELNSLREHVAKLRRGGLTGAKVMHDVVKRRLAPLRKDPKIFPGEADGVLDDAQIWSSMLNLFGEKTAVAIMVTGDEEDDGGEEEVDDRSPGLRRRGRRFCWAERKKMKLPPAATEVTPPLGSGSSSAGTRTRELTRRRKRPAPTPAPSALRRSSRRRRSVGETGGPHQTASPHIEAGGGTLATAPEMLVSGHLSSCSRDKEEEELEKLKRENTQLLQDLKKAMAEKDQCRDTYDRARAALRQINMDPELPAADNSADSCALFGRVVDRLELIVRTLPDRFLESARGVALDTAELVLGHCLRLHPQVDLQRIVKAVVEEEDLPSPETDEAQARVLESARQIANQCVQVEVEAPFGDGEDTSAGTGSQGGGAGSSAADEE